MKEKIRDWLFEELDIGNFKLKKGALVAIFILIALVAYLPTGTIGKQNTDKFVNTVPDYYVTPSKLTSLFAYDERRYEKLLDGKVIELVVVTDENPMVNKSDEEVFILDQKRANGITYTVRVFVSDRDQKELQHYRPGSLIVFRAKCTPTWFKELGMYVIDFYDAYVVKVFSNRHRADEFGKYLESIDLSKEL